MFVRCVWLVDMGELMEQRQTKLYYDVYVSQPVNEQTKVSKWPGTDKRKLTQKAMTDIFVPKVEERSSSIHTCKVRCKLNH